MLVPKRAAEGVDRPIVNLWIWASTSELKLIDKTKTMICPLRHRWSYMDKRIWAITVWQRHTIIF